ncbi:hypothetical protein WKR98_20865 [Pigmentiphaga sp. YJ18]|uniref:hypothetical protein n=1 Tax=Pigmentiphaga sp. YJ18 TaxID=3134907 RepID=UPI003116AA47
MVASTKEDDLNDLVTTGGNPLVDFQIGRPGRRDGDASSENSGPGRVTKTCLKRKKWAQKSIISACSKAWMVLQVSDLKDFILLSIYGLWGS